ncbi:MAG: outer membrane beta-barrel protein [Bacteroidota bacterium]
MKSKLLLICLLCSICGISASAQNSFIKGRWNGKLGYYNYPKRTNNGSSSVTPTLRLEANYGFTKYIEAGAYFGFSRMEGMTFVYTDSTTSGYGNFIFMPFYGIDVNFHILPLFIDKNDFRFDLYVAAKFGGHYCSLPEGNFPSHGNMAEYGIGLGFSFYIFKHLGIFAEYSYGQYDYFDETAFSRYNKVPPTALRYGLTMKFK